MTILVECNISADRFGLGDLIDRHEGLSAELERLVPAENRVIPYVWVTGPPETLGALTATFEESALTRAVTVVDELTIDTRRTASTCTASSGSSPNSTLSRGSSTPRARFSKGRAWAPHWLLRFRFDTHDHVAEFYQYLADNDITDFSVGHIHELTTSSERMNSTDFTLEQREALILAATRGYFDVPRDTNLTEIGDELGITQQAVSDRIRRATRHVVFDALTIPDTPPGTEE